MTDRDRARLARLLGMLGADLSESTERIIREIRVNGR